jgi:pimeloyl-ACP methyl ester carboxylesterase
MRSTSVACVRDGGPGRAMVTAVQSRLIPADDGIRLHVAVAGAGADVVVLSGGPGCVQYLEDDEIAPVGFRAWCPEPRGVGRSAGGAHTMADAVADLETEPRGVVGFEDGVLGAYGPLVIAAGSVSWAGSWGARRVMEVSEK